MSIIGSLNIAKSALTVNQFALNVVSNNVANMNTEGYMKQRVNLMELEGYTPYTCATGIEIYKGGGVGISNISQYMNDFQLGDLMGQNSDLASLNSQLSGLNDLADVLNELGDGALSSALSEFYSAAQYLTQDPSNSVLRINYVNAAETVAETFNQISDTLNSKRETLVGSFDNIASVEKSQAGVMVNDINSILKQITDLNNTIIKTTSNGTVSNELYNQRNQLMQELSNYVDFTTTTNANGSVNIAIGGTDVVKGSNQVAQLVITTGDEANPAKVQIQTMDEPPTVKVSDLRAVMDGGQLGGLLNAASNDAEGITFQKVLNQINLMAKTFANAVNEIQTQTGAMCITLDANGNKVLTQSQEPLFIIPADGVAINASNIKVNQKIYDDPNLVAAAKVEVDVDGNPVDNKAVGDSNNLKEILALQDKNFADLGGVTILSSLENLVTKVGLEATDMQAKVDAQSSVVEQSTTNYQSAGGVNLDEELIDMIKYQRAYEAASRVVSACNQMLQVLVNLGA